MTWLRRLLDRIAAFFDVDLMWLDDQPPFPGDDD